MICNFRHTICTLPCIRYSCPNVAQVLSVSYWADFSHRNKVGQVTANSPGTFTFPPNFLDGNNVIVWVESGLWQLN